MLQMDSQQQTKFYTVPEDVEISNLNLDESLTSISNNQKTSPPETPKSPTSMNNKSAKSRVNKFNTQTKQTSSTNGSTPLGFTNNLGKHFPDMDLSYITPRFIVMTTPRETSTDVSSRSTAESIRDFLDSKHPNSYMLYSLDQTSSDESLYRRELFHNKVVDVPLFNEKQSPRLVAVLWFCQAITSHLLESPSNVVVLHCIDGKNQLSYGACSLLAYHKIYPRVDQIIQYYEYHRCSQSSLTNSQKRYIQYLCDISFGVVEPPHFNEVILKTINISPIPLVNKHKTSCRPFIDIYDEEHKKIFTTYQEISKLRVYTASDPICQIPVNIPFNGDLTIHLTHAALCLPRRTHENGVRICELTINSNFSAKPNPELIYLRNDLDEIDQNEKSPIVFGFAIDITNPQKDSVNTQDSSTQQLDYTSKQSFLLFQNENDFKQKINDYENQIKQQNGDENGKNEDALPSSPVIRRQVKSKNGPIPSNSSNPSSPRNSVNRMSDILPLSPNSPSSFTNPFFHPFKQLMESSSPRSSQIITQPIIQQLQNKEKTPTGNILDGEKVTLERSMSSDRSDFNSSIDSKTDLLDDNFDSNSQKDTPPITLLSPTHAASVPITKPKPSDLTQQLNKIPPQSTPNYDVDVRTKPPPPSSQPKPNPVKPNPPVKDKKNSKDYFDWINGFPKDPAPSPPTTLGDKQKVTLAKDIDPTVLKVREWTEGKKRNLRALLCSLSNVTWPECTWQGCQMNELLSYEQVKKVYRKAVLHIHPDKLRGDPNEALAKLIFVELNEAWSQFEQESS